MSAASNQSVIDLMHVIADTPAVDGGTRVRATILAIKLQERGNPFGSIFADMVWNRPRP